MVLNVTFNFAMPPRVPIRGYAMNIKVLLSSHDVLSVVTQRSEVSHFTTALSHILTIVY